MLKRRQRYNNQQNRLHFSSFIGYYGLYANINHYITARIFGKSKRAGKKGGV